ncbi:hypothetical protein LBMAG52_09000 [Planctomycetia bacterium]|nr:hypothetical protein LBMAG52_09000 [Planctomycetia bacterium]
MTDSSNQLPPTGALAASWPRRWLKWALLVVIFGAGVAVGAAGSVLLIRQRIASVLRQPEQIPDRVVPILRHRLSLTDEQTEQVAAIVRRRYTALEEVRSEFTPRVATELRLLRTEVDAVLTSDQKDRWAIWCQRVEEHLPSTPAQKPD